MSVVKDVDLKALLTSIFINDDVYMTRTAFAYAFGLSSDRQ